MNKIESFCLEVCKKQKQKKILAIECYYAFSWRDNWYTALQIQFVTWLFNTNKVLCSVVNLKWKLDWFLLYRLVNDVLCVADDCGGRFWHNSGTNTEGCHNSYWQSEWSRQMANTAWFIWAFHVSHSVYLMVIDYWKWLNSISTDIFSLCK